MSGDRRFLLDTNAVVSLLAGNRELATLLEAADYVGISVIRIWSFSLLTAFQTMTATVLPASAKG